MRGWDGIQGFTSLKVLVTNLTLATRSNTVCKWAKRGTENQLEKGYSNRSAKKNKNKNYGINSDGREDGFTNIQDKVWQHLRRWNFKGSDIFGSEVLEYSRKGRFVKREINR